MRHPALTTAAAVIASVAAISAVTWPSAPPAGSTGAQAATIPDFSGTWTRDGENPSTFEPPPDGPSGIMTAVPHYGHCIVAGPGVDPTFACPPGVTENRESNPWIADLTNPILQPWTREALKKNVDGEAAGIPHLSFQQNCKPSGVPQILNLRYAVQLLQTPQQVTILYENNQQVRRAYVNEAHPAQLSPSWYGHSTAHYEGDTLVIDTVAQHESTELDRFGTLHSDELHVVERYRLLGPDKMQALVTVTDPKAFTMPWRVAATYRRTHLKPGFAFPEFVCAENNRATHDEQEFTIPTDTTPDF